MIAFAIERITWPIWIHSTKPRQGQSIIFIIVYLLCTAIWFILWRIKFIKEDQEFLYPFEKIVTPDDVLDQTDGVQKFETKTKSNGQASENNLPGDNINKEEDILAKAEDKEEAKED